MTNIISKWKEGLTKTSKATFRKITTLFGATEINENTFDELEALLIEADVGVQTSQEILKALKEKKHKDNITHAEDFKIALRDELLRRIIPPPPITFSEQPYVILIVGVNGSGKTTTIAKLGSLFIKEGKKVVFGAADTFRAAAVDQLQIIGRPTKNTHYHWSTGRGFWSSRF